MSEAFKAPRVRWWKFAPYKDEVKEHIGRIANKKLQLSLIGVHLPSTAIAKAVISSSVSLSEANHGH